MDLPTVGVLGGGQLGRMMAEAGHRLGVKVVALDPLGDDSPTGQLTHGSVKGSFRDAKLIEELRSKADVVTVEIEHVDCDALDAIMATGTPVHPSPKAIRIIQDKYAQKQHFASHNVALGEYREANDAESIKAVAKDFGYPLMLKAKRMAYDGKGNAVVKDEASIEAALASLKTTELYVEKWVPYVKELAVMVARSIQGEVVAYPVVETRQHNNICHCVLAPTSSSMQVQTLATRVACKAVAALAGQEVDCKWTFALCLRQALGPYVVFACVTICLGAGAGIYGVELFQLEDGRVLLNEVAPRPHNSGHYTIEACETDQFEMHLRAILGLPLVGARLAVGASLMLNVLGTGETQDCQSLLKTSLSVPGARVHWYGKSGDRPGRKLAHITVTADDIVQLRHRVSRLGSDAAVEMVAGAQPVVGIIMGSDSDLPTMQAAAAILDELRVAYEMTIVSAHRTPERMTDYSKSAAGRGLKVIIAGAGGAAHLPGMVAAMTPLPVIGVPVKTSTLSGVDSLYSIVQMPRGVPVATVAIGNAKNAGLLAARMLGSTNRSLQERLEAYREHAKEEVLDKAARLEEIGYQAYLDSTATREVK
eukprot:TRINITY_DN3743_c0_g1_i1.p1 TRINITY_DN3743_c0_g1~~TRINITY_DN3743_c0_g1_i1.p1  ORF type:complete len:615 (+),score=126.37 TRINITY_DN3743_c0_g1_i1:67-1845(+)